MRERFFSGKIFEKQVTTCIGMGLNWMRTSEGISLKILLSYFISDFLKVYFSVINFIFNICQYEFLFYEIKSIQDTEAPPMMT